MFPVNGYPLSCRQPGRDPQRQTENPGDDRVEIKRLVRRASVEIDGGAENRDLRDERGNNQTPNERQKH
jgi:hypothetical protein